jgi:NAD binding domain of 6-phosphogluconate dehydrogenase
MLVDKDKSHSALAPGGSHNSGSRAHAAGSGPGGGFVVEGDIGFVGLGRMGTAMAANLAAAGHQVIAYIRRAERIGELAALGLKPTTDIADLLDCGIVVSMLPDDRAVHEIVFGREDFGVDGLAGGLMPGAIHLSMSTISTAAASEFAGAHARSGQGYVAAPVFGNPDAAKGRQLFVIAAGAPAEVERCRPMFDALGQQTFLVGTSPQTANLVKLAGNVMAGATLDSAAKTSHGPFLESGRGIPVPVTSPSCRESLATDNSGATSKSGGSREIREAFRASPLLAHFPRQTGCRCHYLPSPLDGFCSYESCDTRFALVSPRP